MTTGSDWVTDACTLPTAEHPVRVAEWDELLRTAVNAHRRPRPTELQLTLIPQPAVAARAADLAVRESQCCSFFGFAVSSSAGTVELSIRVPDTHVRVLDALAQRIGPPR